MYSKCDDAQYSLFTNTFPRSIVDMNGRNIHTDPRSTIDMNDKESYCGNSDLTPAPEINFFKHPKAVLRHTCFMKRSGVLDSRDCGLTLFLPKVQKNNLRFKQSRTTSITKDKRNR